MRLLPIVVGAVSVALFAVPDGTCQISASMLQSQEISTLRNAVSSAITELRQELDATKSHLAAIAQCEGKTMLYLPTHEKADTDGCIALSGARTESLIAPQLRKLYPSLPLAPDGKDWADIIICPIAGEGALAWVLHSAWNDGRDQDVGYVWADQGVYFAKDSGKLVSSGRNGGRCPENYRDALKIYLGDKPLGDPS